MTSATVQVQVLSLFLLLVISWHTAAAAAASRTTYHTLLLASTALLLPTSSLAFIHPDPDLDEREPLREFQRKLNGRDYGYTNNYMSPEVCRFMLEDDCEVLDTTFENQAMSNMKIFSGNLPQTPRNDNNADPSLPQLSQAASGFEDAESVFKVLVILIQFQNHKDRELIDIDDIRDMWNGEGTNTLNIPAGSIANWTYANSYGKVVIEATVMDWFLVSETEAYYADGRSGIPSSNVELPDLMEAVSEALDDMTSNGFDFSLFDQDDNSRMDGVSIMHTGYGAELGSTPCDDANADQFKRIQSIARWGGNAEWKDRVNGIELGNVAISSAYRGRCNSNIARMGVTTHEFLHTVGLPDLYDITGRLNPTGSVGGMGSFDIM
jgi:M6 family metalloprotease-like protein